MKTVDIDHLSRRVSTSRAPMDFGKEKAIQERYTLVDFHPVVTPPDIPEAIPENVRVSFSEAEAAYSQRLLSSAAACYRKSIERAVKVLHPEGKGTLNARIRQIEVQGLLPQTLVDLLDNVRILGNLSVHEDEVDPTKEECDAARHFARLFLVYTFSLPARIAALKKEVDSDTT